MKYSFFSKYLKLTCVKLLFYTMWKLNPENELLFKVKRLVGEELFTRYDRLLLQSTLDRMADVIYCARKACVAPVVLEPDTTAALCPSCRYAFCTICRKTYHGTSHCKLSENTLLTSGSDSAAESSYAGVPQTEGKRNHSV